METNGVRTGAERPSTEGVRRIGEEGELVFAPTESLGGWNWLAPTLAGGSRVRIGYVPWGTC